MKTREQKREEAEARQAEHNKLSTEEKLLKAAQRRRKSNRECNRLKAQLGEK